MAFLNGVHHVAVAKNAKATVEVAFKVPDANFIRHRRKPGALDQGEPGPYMHIFIDIGGRQHPGLLRTAHRSR